jgi:hypothetical protein
MQVREVCNRSGGAAPGPGGGGAAPGAEGGGAVPRGLLQVNGRHRRLDLVLGLDYLKRDATSTGCCTRYKEDAPCNGVQHQLKGNPPCIRVLHCKGGCIWYRGAAFGGPRHIKGSCTRHRGLCKEQAGSTRYSDLHLQQVPRGSTMYRGIHHYTGVLHQVQRDCTGTGGGGCTRNRGSTGYGGGGVRSGGQVQMEIMPLKGV